MERDSRAELERVQAELALVRRQLAEADDAGAAARAALKHAIDTAQQALAAEDARTAGLEAELRVLEPHVAHLRRELDKKREEDELLARGATMRDQPWVPHGQDGRLVYRRTQNGKRIEMNVSEKSLPLVRRARSPYLFVAIVAFALLVLWWVQR